MGFNKRYIDKERIASTFSRLGIYGVRDLLGLPNGLTGLGRVDAIITQDEFSDKVVTAYQEGRENDVAFDITDEIVKLVKIKEKAKPLNELEKYCLANKIDPYLQTK